MSFFRLKESIVNTLSPEEDKHDVKAGCIYRIHHNTIVGVLRGSNTFPTYSCHLFYTEEFFGGVRAVWNREYEPAQQIFAEGPSGMIARKMIETLHMQLYRRGSNTRTHKGVLKTGADFTKLLKKDKGIVYTYVLHKTKFKFCETGVTMVQDFTSKHAVHAIASPDVYCAGEFHFQLCDNGDYKLVIDNNSGTYSPSLECVHILSTLLRKNFPGLQVEPLDYKDEKLKTYLEILRK